VGADKTAAKPQIARDVISRAAAEWQELGLDTSALAPSMVAIQEAIGELEAAARPMGRESPRQAPATPAD
jgi:hypothetical protein